MLKKIISILVNLESATMLNFVKNFVHLTTVLIAQATIRNAGEST